MLVTGWAVVLLRSLFLFSFFSTLLLFLSPCFSASSSKRWCWRRRPGELIMVGRWLFFLFSACFSAIFPLYVSVFFLLTVTSPLSFLPLFFPPFLSSCSIPPLAFIAKGCMRYGMHMVTAGVRHAPLKQLHYLCKKRFPCLFISSCFFFLKKTMNNA